ncbi:MAG: cupin domain-containing protein [Oscillospiraceae bacterium]|nr:cupin domain-containing protein [Oscillospiraceae bacterium]
MADMPRIENLKREENVFELKPWQSIHNTITKPMVTGLGPAEIPESALAMGFALITAPDILGSPTHVHPFDQWIYLIGSDAFSEFDADVEFTMGEEILKINYPCYIFIPKGVKHCPLNIKRVGKPFIFVDVSITQEASVRPETTASTNRPTYQALNND